MSMLKIRDNVADIKIWELAQKELLKGIWEFTNSSFVSDSNTGFGAWHYGAPINKLISENRFNESHILYNLWNSINSKVEIEKNYKNTLHRLYFNGGVPLYDQTIHQDDEDDGVVYSKNLTLVYFLHTIWDISWGGELVIYDETKKRITGGSFPIPNRAVIFPSYLPHRGVAVSRTCPRMRISIAFQCKYNNTL